jgi:hypothetical protein
MKSRKDKTDKQVAYQCRGKWDSWVKPTGGNKDPDKSFDLKVDGNGNITGKHGGIKIISGTCSVDAATGKHRMQIKREEGDKVYDYDGLITYDVASDTYHIKDKKGTRKTTPKEKPLPEEEGKSKSRGKKKQLPDDEWIAEKTT